MACEDFPCCGHERGCCPDFDASGRQLNMVCVCGAKLPVDAPYSICHHCMKQGNDDFWGDESDDEEAMSKAWDSDYSESDDTPMYEDYYGGE